MLRILILIFSFFMLVFINSAILPFQVLAQANLNQTSVQSANQNIAPIPYPRLNRGNLKTSIPINSATPANTNDTKKSLILNAKISKNGSILLKGVVWRIFKAEPEKNLEMVLLNKSENSPAQFLLKPGDYIVHASYGRAQVSETINVGANVTEKTLILNSGALRLNAAIVGDIPISLAEVKFDILTTGLGDDDKIIVAKNIRANNIINLNAGNYNVISKFGNINATVSADLKVEPGQITDATLYHRAGRVSFKLVSQVGGRAIPDVDWEIKTSKGETIFTSASAFPSTVLSEGDYSIIARRGQNIYNRDFSVQPGPAREIEVSISVY